MKSKIFNEAIYNRFKIRFFYNTTEIEIDPYFISEDNGSKFIYGKPSESNNVKKFEYRRISNIKIFRNKQFSPRIPIIPLIN